MNPYHQFAKDYARLAREAKDYALGTFPPFPRPQPEPGAPKALILSPHPDDEVITGGLALRLLRQSKWNVINVAVTLGSRKDRQAQRSEELKKCCECIGFGLLQTGPNGLDRVNLKTRAQDPGFWTESVKVIADLIGQHQPRAIFFPHAADWNSTHVGTYFLAMDALKTLPVSFECYCVMTEFWRPMDTPNLMVEVSPSEVGDLMTALTFHLGEVERNPYHLSLPAWMVDNVRRGSELIGGQGAAAPDFTFATLYRAALWTGGEMNKFYSEGKFVNSADDPGELFEVSNKDNAGGP